MTKKYACSLFIFRRDLRVEDNIGLIEATRSSTMVIPLFIIDPRQVSNKNTYKSTRAIQFMAESLLDLNKQLKKHGGHLYLMHGNAEECIKNVIKKIPINALFCNRDYTPFSIARDTVIKTICIKNNIDFRQCNDLLLAEPGTILTKNNTSYSKFTPFFRRACAIPVALPQKIHSLSLYIAKIPESLPIATVDQYIHEPNVYITGGTSHALKILKNIGEYKNYQKDVIYHHLIKLLICLPI